MDVDAHVQPALLRSMVRDLGDSLQRMRGELAVSASKGGVDVVTAADQYSERHVVTWLREHYPEHGIVAEEGTRVEGVDWCWYVDPLDGTACYARNLPSWCLSIGLAHQEEPVLGIIYAPALGLLWSVAPNEPPMCNEVPLSPLEPAAEQVSWMVGTDNPWDPSARARNLRLVQAMALSIRMPLMFGSAALAFGYLASGRLDGYVLAHAYSWDYCAGAALTRAVGARVYDWQGDDWSLGTGSMLACRPGMETWLLERIARL